jgi:Lysylphosphatidylglycerol synthase TM region
VADALLHLHGPLLSARPRRPLDAIAAAPRMFRGSLKLVSGIAICLVSIAASLLLARRFTGASWPFEHAGRALVVLAAASYAASFGFRALGWQRVFPRGQRPDCARCLAACGAAAASGAVLPFRLDYLIKIGTLRRLRGVRLGLDTIVLSILALGMVDAVAMLPLAVWALTTSGPLLRAPLIVVVLFCAGCLAALVAGPRLARLPLTRRSRRAAAILDRIAANSTITRSTVAAAVFLFACWTTRALGSAFLLTALGAPFSPTLALVVLCMAGMASILPITAGGAVAGMGATAGVLFALGVSKDIAVNYSLASGLLLTGAAVVAALVGLSGSVAHARVRIRPRIAAGRPASAAG